MRILLLCCLLFVCLTPVSQAQESSKPKADQATVQNLPTGDSPQFFKIRPDDAYAATVESYCAYIRAYRVRRESPDSDAVTPAGYTTCVPSRRFELRSAVGVPAEPAPRQ